MTLNKKYVEGLVSVIIPVYKAEKYIRNTIKSVLDQTYKNVEIVLVDDCSPDNSAEIIKEMKKIYSNIVYYKQEINQGAGVARNKALGLGRGRFVAFLDADDSWKPGKIEKQINLMKETGTPLCYTAIEMVDDDGNVIKGKRGICETCTYKKLLKNTMLATSTIIVDRTQLGDFRMPLRRSGQDYATWLMLLRRGVVARGINEALIQYRTGEKDSLSARKNKNYKKVIDIQVNQEGISFCRAYLNAGCYVINAVKKYLF